MNISFAKFALRFVFCFCALSSGMTRTSAPLNSKFPHGKTSLRALLTSLASHWHSVLGPPYFLVSVSRYLKEMFKPLFNIFGGFQRERSCISSPPSCEIRSLQLVSLPCLQWTVWQQLGI